jgi:CheY-like chemotaxis protein
MAMMVNSIAGYDAGRILIVDDERLVSVAMAHTLKAAGYGVDMAGNGQEALDRMTSDGYDLIICDIKMPVMDGQAFYHRMSRLYPGLSRRVVFCTGDLGNPNTQRFLQDCGAPVIPKPFSLRGVLDLVATLLSEYRCGAQAIPPVAALA